MSHRFIKWAFYNVFCYFILISSPILKQSFYLMLSYSNIILFEFCINFFGALQMAHEYNTIYIIMDNVYVGGWFFTKVCQAIVVLFVIKFIVPHLKKLEDCINLPDKWLTFEDFFKMLKRQSSQKKSVSKKPK
jgi:hypothetical protein